MNFLAPRPALFALIAVIVSVGALPVGAVEQNCRVFVASADMTIAVACPTPVVDQMIASPHAATPVRALHKPRVNANIVALGKPIRDLQLCHDVLELTQLGNASPNDVSTVREACKK